MCKTLQISNSMYNNTSQCQSNFTVGLWQKTQQGFLSEQKSNKEQTRLGQKPISIFFFLTKKEEKPVVKSMTNAKIHFICFVDSFLLKR